MSGAGNAPSAVTHYPAVADNINPYKWTRHRHLAEMKQEIARLQSKAGVYFTPHLVPVNRGILTTAHILLSEPVEQEEVEALYRRFYEKEFFIGCGGRSSPLSGGRTSAISRWRARGSGWSLPLQWITW